MNDFEEYMNSPIISGYTPKRKYQRLISLQSENRRLKNRKKYNSQLFIKAAQNLHLMQADINFARQSMNYQEIVIKQISTIVSKNQKEIDFYKLKENYNAELQNIRDGYQKKVDSYQENVNFANQTKICLLRDINQQADEAEREAHELSLANREQLKKQVEDYIENTNKNLKHELKEAQKELSALQDLSDNAAVARKRIDDFNSMKNQQNFQKSVPLNIGGGYMRQTIRPKIVPSSSRVADQYRAYQEKNKSSSKIFYSPNP